MISIKISVSSISAVLLITLIPGISASPAPVTQAPANPSSSQQQGKPAPGQVNGRREGGGMRNDCLAVSPVLTALVPATEIPALPLPITYVGGLTAAERPTFWFYVPYRLDSALTAEFVLQNSTRQEVYRVSSTEFAASQRSPGIIHVTLPASAAPLQVGQTYRWFFKVNCGDSSSIYTEGGIARMNPNPALAQQLAAASPLQQAELYRANNLWFDAITTIGELMRANPGDRAIAAQWTALLESVGIRHVSATP